MDKIDRKLIHLLEQNARYPIKCLAEEVGLSSPAVSVRLERLEQKGIIRGYTALINPLVLGYHIKAYINLELPPDQKTEFISYIRGCEHVLECDCVTGSFSMLIKVFFPSTVELDAFLSELQKFGKTKTQIVFSTPVENRNVPIPEGCCGDCRSAKSTAESE